MVKAAPVLIVTGNVDYCNGRDQEKLAVLASAVLASRVGMMLESAKEFSLSATT